MNSNRQKLSSKPLPPSALQSATEAKEKSTIFHPNIYHSTVKARDENKIIPSESHFIPIDDFGCAEPKNPLDSNNNSDDRSIYHISPTKQQQTLNSQSDHTHYLEKSNASYRSDSRRTVIQDKDVLAESYATEEISESKRLTICHDKNFTKQNQFDLNSLLHTITTSKDRIKELQESDNLDTIQNQLLNSNELPDSLASQTTFFDTQNPTLVVTSKNKINEKQSFQRNPSTGQFFKCNMTSCEPLQKDGIQNSEVSRYTFIKNVFLEVSNVGFMFTNGLLAGFSMQSLFMEPIAQSETETFMIYNSNQYSGIIKFYLICLSLCITGTAVKRSKGRHAKPSENESTQKNIVAIDLMLLFINCLALVVTMTNAKIELHFEEYHYMTIAGPALVDKVKRWRKLNIARSALCITQWFIYCWQMVRIN